MKLTGKALEDFDKWLWNKLKTKAEDFYDLYFSMQWGVYVDFFDKVGVILDIQPVIAYDNSKYTEIELFLLNITKLNEVMEDTFFGDFKSRQKAQLAAIEKANEIYNTSL